jgi:hypothetical protein
MVLRIARLTLIVAAVLAVWGMAPDCASQAQAQNPNVPSGADLFYNYYVPSWYGAGARLYVAPRPTPPLVGHTYVTYQPLMPHEFLYRHSRVYYRYHNQCGCQPANGRVTRVLVMWH